MKDPRYHRQRTGTRFGMGTLLLTLLSAASSAGIAHERFAPITGSDDKKLEDVLATDLLKTQELEPLFESAKVNRFLSTSLGASSRTWAILTYEPGQMPEEIIRAFVRGAAAEKIPVTESVRSAQRAYHVPGEDMVWKEMDALEQRENLNALHDAIEGKSAYLVLSNFPALESEEARKELVERFWLIFHKCLREGSCRVVMTMPNSVHWDMQRQLPNILSQARTLALPYIDRAAIESVLETATRRLSDQTNRGVSAKALEHFKRFVAVAKNGPASPGREIELLSDAFSWTEANYPDAKTIDASIMRKFIEFEREITGVKDDEGN